MAAFWVTDGIDRCRVGFLPRHHVRRRVEFEGQLVQVTDLLWQSENKAERVFPSKLRVLQGRNDWYHDDGWLSTYKYLVLILIMFLLASTRGARCCRSSWVL
jgi:hypothetical protein